MQAIVRERYGSPDDLELAEVDRPVPGDGEALVSVHAASLNTADLDYLRGFPLVGRLFTGLRRPRGRSLGMDMAGSVVEVGEGVTGLSPGDEVWADLGYAGFGAFAEYVSAPARALHHKPAGLSYEEAATFPHSAILALQGLRGRGPVRQGERVLVNGGGGCVGPFAIQIAKALGAEVTGVDTAEKADLMIKAGADHVIDYTRADFTNNRQQYDLILDIASNRSVLRFRRSLARDGRYVLIARSMGRFVETALVGAVLSLTGSRKMGVFTWKPNNGEDLRFLQRLLEEGRIKPLIDRRFGLGEVAEALRYLEQGRARGKVVIAVRAPGTTT
jgi:NADPH:quinone reductase-like Zn-dependent oxidoreductase